MAAAPPAAGALEAWSLPAAALLISGLEASPSVGDEGDPGGDSAGVSIAGVSVAGVSLVAVVDTGVSTVRVVLDPGEGTAVVCTPEEPAAAPADAPAEEPSPDDPVSAALMFSVKRSS